MSDPSMLRTVPDTTIPGAAPGYHISDPDFTISSVGRAPGVALARRQVIVPTIRAEGPLTQHAQISAQTVTQARARQELLESDPALSDVAIRALVQPDAAPPPAPPARPVIYSTERYPSRLFLTERYTGIASDPVPRGVKRAEYFILNLYCGRRRDGDVQAQIELEHHLSGGMPLGPGHGY